MKRNQAILVELKCLYMYKLYVVCIGGVWFSLKHGLFTVCINNQNWILKINVDSVNLKIIHVIFK